MFVSRSTRDDEGFTLIELMLVIFLIAILSSIAIIVFLNQRNIARDTSVKSDINSLSKSIESAFVLNNHYPDAAELNAVRPKTSPKNRLFVAYYAKDDDSDATNGRPAADVGDIAPPLTYIICGYNVESQRAYVYDTAQGGFADTIAAVGAANGGDCSLPLSNIGVNGLYWVPADVDLVVEDSTAS